MVRRSIFLELHQDFTDDGVECWWANSPDIPGFTAAADTKKALLDRAHAAIKEIITQEEDVLTLTWTEHYHESSWSGVQHSPTGRRMRSDTPCEGSIQCLACDSEWKGYATAPSAEGLYDALRQMLWEHQEVVHNDGPDGLGEEFMPTPALDALIEESLDGSQEAPMDEPVVFPLAPCPSVFEHLGRACELAEGHEGLHWAGLVMWGTYERALDTEVGYDPLPASAEGEQSDGSAEHQRGGD